MTDSAARVRFFPGQFLRAQDLVDEQAHHLAAHRRHNIGQHSWGIVCGLALVADDEGNLLLEPGLAVDGFGRDLVVSERRGVGRQPFDDRAATTLDVYLNYGRCAGVDAGSVDPVDPSADPSYRWQETPFLTFEDAEEPPVDRRRPPHLLESDAAFDPTGTPPDEPGRRWPVFLGSATLDRGDAERPFTVDPSGRPYAGLVGQEVRAPSGDVRVQVGAADDADPNRFAVHVSEAGTEVARLAVRRDQTVEVRGDTTVHGALVVERALELAAGADDVPALGGLPLVRRVGDELRVELGAAQRLVVGTWSTADAAFAPGLTVTGDSDVTVHGDLVIEGRAEGLDGSGGADVQTGPVVDTGLGADAQRLSISSFAAGVAGAGALLGAPGGGAPAPDLFVVSLATVQAAAQVIGAFPDRASEFAELLLQTSPGAAATLREALRAAPDDGDGPP